MVSLVSARCLTIASALLGAFHRRLITTNVATGQRPGKREFYRAFVLGAGPAGGPAPADLEAVHRDGWTRMRCLGKPFGMRASLRRQTIALITAYAVALQALLPALALLVSASADQLRLSVEVCANAVDSSGEIPRQHHNGCTHGLVCVTNGCSGMAAALLPEHLQFGPGIARSAVPALRPVDWVASATWLPHGARAPPRA
jgi:hypothetical protein